MHKSPILFAAPDPRYLPKESWWIRGRAGFSAECDRQASRMRSSYWGLRSTESPYSRRAPSSLEQYKALKQIRESRRLGPVEAS